MPYSTNAPRNDQGWAQVLRDIEVLYLKLQELNNGNYINNEDGSQGSGDLNPGGGSQVSQQIPDDAWGRSRSRNASPVIHSGTWEATRGGIAAGGASVAIAGWGVAPATIVTSDLLGLDPVGGSFTAQDAGLYAVALTGTITWNCPAAPTGVGFALQVALDGAWQRAATGFQGNAATGGLDGLQTASGVFRLRRGSVLVPYAYCVSGGGTFAYGCSLTIAYLGATAP